MANLKFSVVIPVFKRRKLAQAAIKSVLSQEALKREDTEIIVVDDESNARAAKKNKLFYQSLSSNLIYLRNKFDKGPGGSRQTGLEKATGKFLTFLDSDDQLKPQFFKKISGILSKRKKIIAALSFSDAVFDKGVPLTKKIKLIPLMIIRDFSLHLSFLLKKNLFPDSFYLCQVSHMIFIKSMVSDLRFNSLYIRGGEDWDFITKTLKCGNIRIVPEKLIRFRYSQGSLITKKVNRKGKWDSYQLLVNNLPSQNKKGPFYFLFIIYIFIGRILL